MPSTHPLPPKKEVALALLERSSVHVHLDPRAAGVVVPAWFKKQPQLVLQIGLNMPVPIPDLRLDEDGMGCTLSFNRAPFFCVVPWTSVYAMVGDDGRGMVWPDDVPPEVAQQARAREASDVTPPQKKPASKRTGETQLMADKPSTEKTAKAKKPRKKRVGDAEPEVRASLVAVPSPSNKRTPTAQPVPPQLVQRAPAEAPPRPLMTERRAPNGTHKTPPSPQGGAPQNGSSGRPKRELPPYLRVVK